jgi:hypothetical protein
LFRGKEIIRRFIGLKIKLSKMMMAILMILVVLLRIARQTTTGPTRRIAIFEGRAMEWFRWGGGGGATVI